MRYRLRLLERDRLRFVGRVLAGSLALALAACGGEPANEPAEQAAPGAAPEQTGVASVYTDFDLAACTVLDEEREQGSSASYRCAGFGDVALFVQEGDGRFDLDAGVDDGTFQTIAAFNDIGDTVEWRLRDGRPVAIVFRYRDVTLERGGRTVLAVETVGADGAPGCRVAQIAGDTPEANLRARELADAAAQDGFVCPAEPRLIGNAG